MRQVWKFPLPVDDFVTIEMPAGARFISVGVQDETPFLWAIVDPKESKGSRRFRVAGTGHPLMLDRRDEERFVGTFQLRGGALIFHVFECHWTELPARKEKDG